MIFNDLRKDKSFKELINTVYLINLNLNHLTIKRIKQI